MSVDFVSRLVCKPCQTYFIDSLYQFPANFHYIIHDSMTPSHDIYIRYLSTI